MSAISTSTSSRLSKQILTLLHRSSAPLVRVAPSRLDGAGQGIFATENVSKGVPVCLYPGIFTPGMTWVDCESDSTVYLGNLSCPSGVKPIESNAYILNLQNTGGYLDGLAIEGLDENPNACGHFANHSSKASNVEVVSFWWLDVVDFSVEHKDLYDVPNTCRVDGSPWLMRDGEIYVFKEAHSCAGAAFQTTREIMEGEEIYLDYGLTHPLPSWARDWYDA